ncbi:MAG: radical SAM protein, partial [Firmicutes bacterium]|nr:radical SAM protein [Bacillota bacterium]
HDLDKKTIDSMRNNKHVMPFFHLPVQSGSNKILKRMNRHYTKESYLEVLSELKKNVPGITVTTDIIVGFPGETEEDFLETLDLVEKAQFEGAFTFVFSKREGTPAAQYEDDIPQESKKERLYMLNDRINTGYLKGNQRFLDTTVKVLVDGVSKHNEDVLAGYSEHNKLVNFKGDKCLIGQIVDVKIKVAKTWFLLGEKV